MEEMKYAFISHKNIQPDQDITMGMYKYLSDRKLAAWYDIGLKVGDWPAQLSKKLRGAAAYILIASKDSLLSNEVLDEIGIMRQESQKHGKPLIPFVIDDYFFNMEPGSAADYFLGSNRNQALILSKFANEEMAFDRLADYLLEVLGNFVNDPADFEIDDARKILKKYKGHDRMVKLPANIREIGANAFAFNCNLEKVEIPSSVKVIGKRAFFGCESLLDVEGMDGIESCDITAFDRTGIYIGKDNDYLLNGVIFGGEITLDGELVMPQSARVIATRAFPCKNISHIIFPDGLEHIGVRAFVDCFGLTEIKFPVGIKSVGLKAFDGCATLERAVFEGEIPENIENAFNNNVIIIGGTDGKRK